MFSWLKPIILNKNNGKQKIIKQEKIKDIFEKIKLNKQNTKASQIIFKNKVETSIIPKILFLKAKFCGKINFKINLL